MNNDEWQARRAALGFIELARDAIASSRCIVPDRHPTTDHLYAAAVEIQRAYDAIDKGPLLTKGHAQ